jgi:ribosome-binding factor A
MSRRSERTSKLIQREISGLLEREVNDPRLSKFVSVTEVTISPDLIERGARLLKLMGELSTDKDDKISSRNGPRINKGGNNGTNKRIHNRCR